MDIEEEEFQVKSIDLLFNKIIEENLNFLK